MVRVGRVVKRVFLFRRRSPGREKEDVQSSKQPPSEKRHVIKIKINASIDLPLFLF